MHIASGRIRRKALAKYSCPARIDCPTRVITVCIQKHADNNTVDEQQEPKESTVIHLVNVSASHSGAGDAKAACLSLSTYRRNIWAQKLLTQKARPKEMILLGNKIINNTASRKEDISRSPQSSQA
jgi:hypothetical protein